MKKQFTFLCLVLLISVSNVRAQLQSNFIGSGIALQFNGSIGNYLDLGDVYNSLAFPFSFEAWINPSVNPSVWGGIMGSDNDASAYYGFWIRTSSTGRLQVEFGDGLGSGFQFRRGYITTTSVGLNEWTHIAVVCGSVTDVHFYFNGVEQSKTPTDGGSAVTSLTHSSASASIAGQSNVFGNQMFIGQIDEIRLWKTARTETNIRDFMCKKVDAGTSGLLGYWTADESYTSNTVNDITTPAQNGTILGTVSKPTSGAPIGDASKYLYTSTWSGMKINLGSPSNDQLSVKSVTGDPLGVQVYRVDAAPYFTSGLGVTPDYYYGVFCAEGNSVANFKAIYKYDSGNGTVDPNKESSLTLYKRADGSVSNWSNLNATLDTVKNKLSKNNQVTRREYILNIPTNAKFAEGPANSVDLSQVLGVYPNPANQKVSLTLSNAGETISAIRIADVTGKILQENNELNQDQVISIDISDLNNGVYFVSALTSAGWRMGKFEVQK